MHNLTSYVFGGGCFWCLDAIYRRIRGVASVESGYAGGDGTHPNYYRVSSGKTGHAEVVRVAFDESIIPAAVVLDIFFLTHNPTTLNRQGADEGTQYRSIMLYSDDKQKQVFESSINKAQNIWSDPIVTELSPLKEFYPAESEHQDYYSNNSNAGYCTVVIEPKIAKARSAYDNFFK